MACTTRAICEMSSSICSRCSAADQCSSGAGPFAEVDVDTAKFILREVDCLSRTELAESFEDADRALRCVTPPPSPPPVTSSRSQPRTKPGPTPNGGGCASSPELGGTEAPAWLQWALGELRDGRQPGVVDLRRRTDGGEGGVLQRHRAGQEDRADRRRQPLGCHVHGPHRAGSRPGCRGRPRPRRTQPGRHLNTSASSGSSPPPNTIWPTTSCTWWLRPPGRRRGRRWARHQGAQLCSWCPCSTSILETGELTGETQRGPTPLTSRRRWA